MVGTWSSDCQNSLLVVKDVVDVDVVVVVVEVVLVDDNCKVQFTIPEIEPGITSFTASEDSHQHLLWY